MNRQRFGGDGWRHAERFNVERLGMPSGATLNRLKPSNGDGVSRGGSADGWRLQRQPLGWRCLAFSVEAEPLTPAAAALNSAALFIGWRHCRTGSAAAKPNGWRRSLAFSPAAATISNIFEKMGSVWVPAGRNYVYIDQAAAMFAAVRFASLGSSYYVNGRLAARFRFR